MDLVSIPANPTPSNAVVASVTSAGGVKLRVARWRPTAKKVRGTVYVLQGRAEFIEKYFEVIGELRRRGFHVVAFDWRGQGGSDRLLADPRKGHVDDFDDYVADLAAVMDATAGRPCPEPFFALAHSMGGAILIRALQRKPDLVERAVLSAPMIEISGLRRPRRMHWLAAALDVLGLGGAYIPGGGQTAVATKPFATNPLTSDPARYGRTAAIVEEAPGLALGDPTIGWVHAAFRAMEPFKDPNFPLQLPTPLLIVAGSADAVTITAAAERFAARLKAGRAIVLPGAMHELLVERDPVRSQFWAAFDAFVPGAALTAAREAMARQDADAPAPA
ncbi:alpha/beta fold hydrolase [Alsobacter sp. SYSU BS001988]